MTVAAIAAPTPLPGCLGVLDLESGCLVSAGFGFSGLGSGPGAGSSAFGGAAGASVGGGGATTSIAMAARVGRAAVNELVSGSMQPF